MHDSRTTTRCGGCTGFERPPATRREFLWRLGSGLGGIALAHLLGHEDRLRADEPQQAAAATARRAPRLASDLLAPRAGHFPARARRVIVLFMTGACSQVDTFDYKPEIIARHGEPLPGSEELDLFFGQDGVLMRSPWQFRQHGQCGKWVSDLLPHLAECVDDMTFIHSMQARSSSHGPAVLQMSTGFTLSGFPSMGSWVVYGLGTESQDLPAFVALPDVRGVPTGGTANWSSGFLPAVLQGTPFEASGDPVRDLFPDERVRLGAALRGGATEAPPGGRDLPGASRELLAEIDRRHLEAHPGDEELAARIRAYELAARMQLSVPDVIDFSDETQATRDLYGLDEGDNLPTSAGQSLSAAYGRNCLLARRLIERGVRFVEVFCGGYNTSPRINWDAHEDIEQNHGEQAAIMDRPTAGLLRDLKQRGLLEDTLVVWATEFGRMPISQGRGRDHNPHGFTVWLAGGGAKPGFSYGATDEFSHRAVENPTTIYDLHATILYLLGLDHRRLTFYHNGIERRLTDVHGDVIEQIVA